MKIKLVGNFTEETIGKYERLKLDASELDEKIDHSLNLGNPLVPSGLFVIIDELDPFAKRLQSFYNFTKDEAYTPKNHAEKLRLEKEAKEKQQAENKKAQDEIDEKENKPNLIKTLEDPDSGFFHERDSNWWNHPERKYSEVAEYFEQMIEKQNLVSSLSEPEWRPENGKLNVIYRRRNENQKKLPEVESNLEKLKVEKIKIAGDIEKTAELAKTTKKREELQAIERQLSKEIATSNNIDMRIRGSENFIKSVADDVELFDLELPKYKKIEKECVEKYSTKTLKELREINQKLIDEAKKKIGE